MRSEFDRKKELNEIVQMTLKKNSSNNKFIKDLETQLENRIPLVKINSILNSRGVVTEVNDHELYWLTKFLLNCKEKHEVITSIREINYYYNDLQMHNAENYFIAEDLKNNYITIPNVKMVSDDEFICYKLDYKLLKHYYENGFLRYNFESQRESSVIDIKVAVIEIPTVYRYNVEQIKEKVKKKKFKPNMLTANILKTDDNEVKFDYIPEKETLVIYGYIDLCDGQHRTIAIDEALTEDSSIEGHVQFKIFNYNIIDIQDYVHQESEGSKISIDKAEYLKQDKFSKLVKELNKEDDETMNALYDKISESEDLVYKSRKAYCTFSTIKSVLEEQWCDVLNEPIDIRRSKKFLIDFYNYTTGYYSEYFKNFKEEESIPTSNGMFVLYTYLALKLYDSEKGKGINNWEDILEMFLSSLNFSDIELWEDILLIKSKRIKDKRVRRRIYDYVNTQMEVLKDVI